jgi:V/A-type H+-transporting ATPase subunit E
MAEELQSLLDRIRIEGVEKAQAEAEQIRAEARKQAARLVAEAEQTRAAMLEDAGRKAQTFEERGHKALERAARDLTLMIGEAITEAFRTIVRRDIHAALTTETLKQMLVEVVRAYCVKQGDGSRIDLLVSPEQHKDIVAFFMSEFQQAIQKGVEIHPDGQLVRGFKVSLSEEHLYHDFSEDAILESLCQLLRPELAEIVKGIITREDKGRPPA